MVMFKTSKRSPASRFQGFRANSKDERRRRFSLGLLARFRARLGQLEANRIGKRGWGKGLKLKRARKIFTQRKYRGIRDWIVAWSSCPARSR